MDSGDLSDLDLSELQQYLGHTEFPADKQEVASNAENNEAPQAVVARIRNSSIECFDRQLRGGAAGGARALEEGYYELRLYGVLGSPPRVSVSSPRRALLCARAL